MESANSLVGTEVSVRSIMLQFSFSNAKVVPKSIEPRNPESLDDAFKREKHANGRRVIDPVKNVDVLTFVEGLTNGGYKLAKAFSQKRPKTDDPSQSYYIARFDFEPWEEDFEHGDASARHNVNALKKMCYEAMWQVKVFVNPFFSDGKEVAGEYTVSINMSFRQPLYNNVGKPIKRWRKDEDGERVGEAAVPLRPDYCLSFSEGVIDVLPANSSQVS